MSDGWVHPHAPIVALDIDGTLADYYKHFKWFAELYLQHPLPLDWSGTDEFSDALGMDKDTYRDVKLAYRQGGMKRSIPLRDADCYRLADRLRNHGIAVWICTTRPWQRLDNIDPDTQFWINRNIGRVDGVIYGEDKYRDLIAINGAERILGVVDDLPENIERAKSLGLSAAIRAGLHNQAWRAVTQNQTVVHSGEGIYQQTMTWMEKSNADQLRRGSGRSDRGYLHDGGEGWAGAQGDLPGAVAAVG